MYIYRSACELWYSFDGFYIDLNFVARFTINSKIQNIINYINFLLVCSIRTDTIHEMISSFCDNWIVRYGRCDVCVCVQWIITYLLTPWSRVLLEKLTCFADNLEIPRISWIPEVHYHTHKRPPTVPVLSQIHLVYITISHFLKIHLNIILPSTSWSPQWPLSLRFPHQNPARNSLLPHTCYMPRPFHSS